MSHYQTHSIHIITKYKSPFVKMAYSRLSYLLLIHISFWVRFIRTVVGMFITEFHFLLMEIFRNVSAYHGHKDPSIQNAPFELWRSGCWSSHVLRRNLLINWTWEPLWRHESLKGKKKNSNQIKRPAWTSPGSNFQLTVPEKVKLLCFASHLPSNTKLFYFEQHCLFYFT